MIVTVDKFMVPIRLRDGIESPVFDNSIKFTSKKFKTHYEISVYSLDNKTIQNLKDRYIWLSEEVIDFPL